MTSTLATTSGKLTPNATKVRLITLSGMSTVKPGVDRISQIDKNERILLFAHKINHHS